MLMSTISSDLLTAANNISQNLAMPSDNNDPNVDLEVRRFLDPLTEQYILQFLSVFLGFFS
ncbi:hypothetical protein BC936DRAFT_148303 [Jimgerdemannia flammicorona]|uniref:Uncharacterized protein n=1 Tax=Jimgerdemannia flammicorona TaxID=994334 RepID=A0A433D3H4_9FUNG|nr:hypothetical protein BC936DRAFT_148303 [Jimgerdemannia flammicorona]